MLELRSDRRNLALQLRDRVREMLHERYFRAGDKLPSEESLSATFGVSRGTVREALKLLEEERVIFCRHGSGRFLAMDPSSLINEDVTRLQSVTEMASSLGIEVTTKVISCKMEIANEIVCSHLRLEPGSKVLTLERSRLAGEETIIYSIDVIPVSLVKGVVDLDVFSGSLVSTMERIWGIKLSYARTKISAAILEPALCERLAANCNEAWILMEQVNFDDHDQPILYSKDYHRGDKIQFYVLRRRN